MRNTASPNMLKGLFILCLIISGPLFFGCEKKAPWVPGMPLEKEDLKIGIILPNSIDTNSIYDYAHYQGTLEMKQSLGLSDSQIIRRLNIFDSDPAAIEGAIRDCIAEGANFIIAASWGYMDICEKLADEFPSVIFAHATGYKYNSRNFTNYSAKIYQARYLAGIAAGLTTKTGKIGYVAAMGKGNSEVTGGINAFAIGVERVNPGAQVFVQVTHSWFDPMGEAAAARSLIGLGCDLITVHSNTQAALVEAERAGVLGIGFNSDMSADAPGAVISSVVIRWGKLYTHLAESIINGTFHAAPYLLGLAEGVVDITPVNESLAAIGTAMAVESGRRRILQEGFNIFDGVLETNDGRTVGEINKTLSNDSILSSIDWYYKNVVIDN
jgi:basic membrane protein A